MPPLSVFLHKHNIKNIDAKNNRSELHYTDKGIIEAVKEWLASKSEVALDRYDTTIIGTINQLMDDAK